jgi:hypothetical protein
MCSVPQPAPSDALDPTGTWRDRESAAEPITHCGGGQESWRDLRAVNKQAITPWISPGVFVGLRGFAPYLFGFLRLCFREQEIRETLIS